jgi:DNA-binding GntR family transcriptional regulator
MVLQPTRQDIIELYDVREALETHAVASLAGRGLLPQDVEAIEKITDEMRAIKAQLKKSGKSALEGEALQRFTSSDLRFHMRLLQASGNRRLVKIIHNTRLLIRIFTFRRAHHTLELVTKVHDFHCQILDAVRKKEPETAARLMREHIRLSLSERLAEYQQEWNDMPPDGLDLF